MPLESCPRREHRCTTRSAAETRSLGVALAAHTRAGDLICLSGDLGAGKTTFIQGLAQGLGVEDLVTSPSFTLVHQHDGRPPLYHLDLYRIGAGDLADIGIDEIIGSQAVVAVEWAERLPPELRRDGLEILIQFDPGDQDKRGFILRPRGPQGLRMLTSFREDTNARTCH